MRARLFIMALSAATFYVHPIAAQEPEPGAAVTPESQAQPAHHLRLSKLIGSNIQTRDGVGLGKIEDVVVNPQTGQVQFALVSKGEFSGVGDKFMPVPWQTLNIKAEKEYSISVDRQDTTLPAPDPDAVGKAAGEVGAEGGGEIRPDDTERQKQ